MGRGVVPPHIGEPCLIPPPSRRSSHRAAFSSSRADCATSLAGKGDSC
jgi:hypothetical protein